MRAQDLNFYLTPHRWVPKAEFWLHATSGDQIVMIPSQLDIDTYVTIGRPRFDFDLFRVHRVAVFQH